MRRDARSGMVARKEGGNMGIRRLIRRVLSTIAYRRPMAVTCARYLGRDAYPVCPRCRRTMAREFQAYCDRCGQHLSWDVFCQPRKCAPSVSRTLPKVTLTRLVQTALRQALPLSHSRRVK